MAGPKELVSFLVNGDHDQEFVLVFPVPNDTEDWHVGALMRKEPAVRRTTSSRSYRVHVSRFVLLSASALPASSSLSHEVLHFGSC